MLNNPLKNTLFKSINLTRYFSLQPKKYGAHESPLYKLRQRTGLAYNLCREALNKHDNKLEEAEIWLKAQALALGLQKATKVGTRSTREGLIGLSISNDNRTATVLKVNCETDFVAKNQIFKDLALDLTHQASLFDIEAKSEGDHVTECYLSDEHLSSIKSDIVPVISKLGENIQLDKVFKLIVDENSLHLFGQTHAEAQERVVDNNRFIIGRYAAIVALKDLDPNKRDLVQLKRFGNRLCRHVIGFNPSYIELPGVLRKQLEESMRESQEVLKKELAERAKEEELSEPEDESMEDSIDWPSLMDQNLIMAEGLKVKKFCQDNDFNVVYFNRLECGSSE